MEKFSRAYVHAIAAAGGYRILTYDIDDDGVDLGLAGRNGDGQAKSPQIDLQLKCTADDTCRNANLIFPLEMKNYETLRDKYLVPRILVVVVVPSDIEEWLLHDPEFLAICKCGYWYSLRGFPSLPNTSTSTLEIPKKQAFTVNALHELMGVVATGGAP